LHAPSGRISASQASQRSAGARRIRSGVSTAIANFLPGRVSSSTMDSMIPDVGIRSRAPARSVAHNRPTKPLRTRADRSGLLPPPSAPAARVRRSGFVWRPVSTRWPTATADQAEAVRVYAVQAKDCEMELPWAAEIRLRAERRAGGLVAEVGAGGSATSRAPTIPQS
jgi:hypothetical protein